MDTVLIEAIPARTFRFNALQVSFAVKFSAIVEHIVLAWHVKDILCSATLENLIEGVELLRLRQLRNVSRVNEERWRGWHRVDAIKSNFEGRSHIFVCLFVEADMTVADLQKAKVCGRQWCPSFSNFCKSF